jgi:dynactin complex subunit
VNSTDAHDAHEAADDDDEAENEDQEAGDAAASPDKEDASAQSAQDSATSLANGVKNLAVALDTEDNDAAARFDALVKDRDALRQEVTQLRQSLEELQAKHTSEIEAVQVELADTQAEKETAEEQYQSLLGKVNTIRSQLGERLKADAVCSRFRPWSSYS